MSPAARTRALVLAAFVVSTVVVGSAGPARAPARTRRPAGVADDAPAARVEALKREAVADVAGRREFTQQMVDQIFSYGELGFQEVETSKYVTGILEKNGFTIDRGIAEIPTAWMATWGAGRPVIAIGADLDALPQASQKPGVAYHSPLVEGAPGHGEGHNAGQAVNVTAVLAVKRIMEREHLSGTLKVWPGIAEELVGSKAWYVRDGYFDGVDIALFSHVDTLLRADAWGDDAGNGMVSVEYTFTGESAHAATAPWRGRSALDAVELMDVGWNFRREHLRLQQRSHDVILDGGDQPNVVPPTASVWYYFRENDYPHIKDLWDTGNRIARAAAMMTDTTVSWRILGAAWPKHLNRPLSEVMQENVLGVGAPDWSSADQDLARAVQREVGASPDGLASVTGPLDGPVPPDQRVGGGSDDIGDVSWTVPTVSLRFPSNVPNLPGHSWADAVAMATPIAHKGATAGAKVLAMTMIDVLLRPSVVQSAWRYFREIQTGRQKYVPFIAKSDPPATWLNRRAEERYRPQLEKYYFDPTRYKTYLQQLGISYPTLHAPVTTGGG